ncbi:class I SAM-dependent methyltransferase [Pararhodobacter oceanensis]|uniref:class I SAM-dependent methyltransferase n=1 Tax=Pararhodobacter oceanensis TaxID=2172121 RepID=UPI001402B076|nr:class I SAM-dependent methyltransferase [Pararhodobacter oceanensis]
MPTIVKLFRDLDRLSPGSAESLRWALAVAATPKDARILDAGCGTGADLATLNAAAPQGEIVALDIEPDFIGRVRARYPKIAAHIGDMTDPPAGPYDLIWSSGAVYNVGITAALTAWRPHLAEGGRVAFSDLRARSDNPPAEVREFWAEVDLQLRSTADLEQEIAAAGYRLLDARWVGPAGWASYYGPIEVELDGFTAAPELIAHLKSEIALWRSHGVNYGARLVVVAPE